MNAIILSIGDELVLGQTVDTNSAWLSQQLAAVGCEILAHETVPDNQHAIESAMHRAISRCDFLIISGGIGPTEDDLTRQALAAVLNQPLELNRAWLTRLEDFFKKLGRPMPPTNRIQSMIPRSATMIENSSGTAAGIDAILQRKRPALIASASDSDWARLFGAKEAEVRRWTIDDLQQRFERMGLGKPTRVFVMPGVPKEMKVMFTSYVLPIIKQQAVGAVILSKTLHTFGVGESSVAEKLGDLMKRDRNPSVGTTVANGIVSLRLNARFPTKDEAQSQLAQTESACRAALGDLIFGSDDETLQQVVANLITRNSELGTRNFSISTAESCTGGLLAKMLTDIPGSSSYFTQGWVTYSNEAKRDRLGVSENIINMYGAVSEPTVTAMAAGARRLAKSDYALAISGVAGPTGGTPAKPIGTVCIALAFPSNSELRTSNSELTARTFLFTGDREMIRDRAAKMALTMLRFHLLSKPLPF